MEEVYTKPGNSTPAGEDRAAYCEYMMEMAGGAMKFETRAKKVFRHKPAATMVRQLLFWDGKGSDPEGYIYKTHPEWWDEEGLTRTEIDTARHKLGDQGAGVLEEVRKGVFNRLHYRLNLERLWQVMFPELDPPTVEDPVPEDQTLNHDFTVQDSSDLECRVPVVQSAGMGPSHNREYSKNTSNSYSRRASSKDEQGSPRIRKEIKKPHRTDTYMKRVAKGAKDCCEPLEEKERNTIAGNIKWCIEHQGATPEEMACAVDHMLEYRDEGEFVLPSQMLESNRAIMRQRNNAGTHEDPTSEEFAQLMAEYEGDASDEEDIISDILARIEEGNDVDTATELDSPGMEEGPEGSTTPETVEAYDGALDEAVSHLLASPHDNAVGRLALGVVEGKHFRGAPITREDVAYALRDELDLSEVAAGDAADRMIEAVRNEQEVRA